MQELKQFMIFSEIWNFFQRHSLESTTATRELHPLDVDLRAYPNPVYDQFTIEFNLPEASRVQLTIFNNLGQPLYTRKEERLTEGQFQFNWETEPLPAGIYYYQLQIGTRQISQPIILMARE